MVSCIYHTGIYHDYQMTALKVEDDYRKVWVSQIFLGSLALSSFFTWLTSGYGDHMARLACNSHGLPLTH